MIFFKHRLRKKLPYYRLTRTAKRRLDEIADLLPPREAGAIDLTLPAEQEVNRPRHLKQRAPQPIQPVREHPAAVFLRVAVCAVVGIAFVGVIATLLLLRSAAPGTLLAASSELAPTAAPTPAPLYTMEIENAEIRGDCAFFDVVLTFREAEYRHAAFYTTALNAKAGVTNAVLSIDGKTAKLDGSPIFYQEDTLSRYRASVSAKLPETYTGGSVEGKLTISALYGMNFKGDRNIPITEPDFTVEEHCTQSFELTEATPWTEVVGAANGVSLESVNYYYRDSYEMDNGEFVVRIKYPDLDSFEASVQIADQDGRSMSYKMVDDKSSNGDGTVDQLFYFEGVTPETERLVLRVWFSYFVEQTLDTTQVLAAEYTLFPQEDWFMRSGEYQDEGMEEVFDMERITANWKRISLCFSDHIFLTFISPHYATLDEEYVLPELNVFLHSDLPWALPLQCEITATGREKIVIPLYGEPPAESQEKPENAYFSMESYERAGLPYRAYSVTATFGIDPDFWRENDAQIVIRNTVSGRVLVNTWAIGRHSDYNGDMDDQATPSEAPADPEPSPEPPAESQPPESQPEDGQSSEPSPEDSQSSADVEPEQPPEGEASPTPDDAS